MVGSEQLSFAGNLQVEVGGLACRKKILAGKGINGDRPISSVQASSRRCIEGAAESCGKHNPLNLQQLPPQRKAPYVIVNRRHLLSSSQLAVFAAQRLQQALPILKRRWGTDFHPSLVPRQRKRLQGRTRSREEWITAIEMIRPHVLNDSQRASLMKEESMSPQSNT